MIKSLLLLLTFSLLSIDGVTAEVNSSSNLVTADDYSKLDAEIESLPKLILVSWYGSESSQRAYRALVANQQDVVLWPAVFREKWRPAAKLMLMSQQLNASADQHLAFFSQLQNDTLVWTNESYKELLTPLNPKNEQIEQVIFSSELPKQLKSIQNQIQQFSISSVPTIIFKGRYIISAEQAHSPAKLIEILNYLEQQPE